MTRRDFLLVAIATAFGSLVTHFAGANKIAPTEAQYCERNAAVDRAAASGKPGDPVRLAASDEVTGIAASPRQSAPSRDGTTRADDGGAAAPALAFREQQQLEKRFSSLLTDVRPGALNARIENRFYSEEWNQQWAGDNERNIRTLFEADQDLRGIAPLQVTCRSKNCQVVLAASSQEQVRTLSEKFMQAARRGDVGMKDKIVSFFPDVSTGSLVFYLSENGNTDLFQ